MVRPSLWDGTADLSTGSSWVPHEYYMIDSMCVVESLGRRSGSDRAQRPPWLPCRRRPAPAPGHSLARPLDPTSPHIAPSALGARGTPSGLPQIPAVSAPVPQSYVTIYVTVPSCPALATDPSPP